MMDLYFEVAEINRRITKLEEAAEARETATAGVEVKSKPTVFGYHQCDNGPHAVWVVTGPQVRINFSSENDGKDAAHLANLAYKRGWDDAQRRAAQHKEIIDSISRGYAFSHGPVHGSARKCEDCKSRYVFLPGGQERLRTFLCHKFTHACISARSNETMCGLSGSGWEPR